MFKYCKELEKSGEIIETLSIHRDGRMHLFAGVCKQIGLSDIFNRHMKVSNGRDYDIDPGIEAQLLVMPMVAEKGYRALHQLSAYYEGVDLSSVFGKSVDSNKINDSRFGYFLDQLYSAGPAKVFSEVAMNALKTYGIVVNRLNFDTTSMVMWGEYVGIDEDCDKGIVQITFGHSKAKRSDKKQIKLALGTADGTIVSAKVLDGNEDDKTYNTNQLDSYKELLKALPEGQTDKIYYVADSALFTETNLEKIKDDGIYYVTRAPDKIKIISELIQENNLDLAEDVYYINAHGEKVPYKINRKEVSYANQKVYRCVAYSPALEPKKLYTIQKRCKEEQTKIQRLTQSCSKQTYDSMKDARRELNKVTKKIGKTQFHEWDVRIRERKINAPGKKAKDPALQKYRTVYELVIEYEPIEGSIEAAIEKECTFVVCTNDEQLSTEAILMEYKTQNAVEVRFRQLKSPDFVNSLYLEKPERIVALAYMILITLTICSIIETVVRRGLKSEDAFILGHQKRKHKRPTSDLIFNAFFNLSWQNIETNMRRVELFERGKHELNTCQKRILRYLGLESILNFEMVG